ncbi:MULTISPECIES: hypothetical protein [unclassified Streptomyces]|uniref:hypothetical protein n=1 Tax=unclassified Streptomyces TaxID=2593676 RepID=UPI0013718195|nr:MULTISPECIES: hypothetical protein [unclassified Streptomyces]MYY85159.1 hypothetical protein [Streptomyces sp. SID335]MYZ15182.1 hypothetical protein [Streptomyces sp. SID337]NEB45939.1 hypothetical protein [Streptomyces sp. SID339]
MGYNLVPPPGWDHIPLKDGSTNDVILRIVDRAVSELPQELPRDDVSRARMELFKQLKKAAKQAAKGKGLSLYLPVERIHGIFVPASFVVSEMLVGQGADVPTEEVLRLLAADRGESETVDVDGVRATRIERIVPPEEGTEIEYASRRVEYVVPVPGATSPQWLTVAFSTIGDGHPDGELSDVLVDVFDAVMTTFRWSYA